MKRFLQFENGVCVCSFMARQAPEATDGVEYREAPEDWSPDLQYELDGDQLKSRPFELPSEPQLEPQKKSWFG